MKLRTPALVCSITLAAALGAAVRSLGQGNQPQFITVDIGTFQTGTFSINARGEVAGYYQDANIVNHGFVRSSNGTTTTFDGPSAHVPSSGVVPQSIGAAGDVTGYYIDDDRLQHAFVRDKHGVFTVFDVGPYFTTGTSINAAGEIAGFYGDASGFSHGFVRSADGTVTTFDPPGALTTGPNSIDEAGNITGGYGEAGSQHSHGFLRTRDGEITSFDVPGDTVIGTFGTSISDSGEITGTYSTTGPGFGAFIRARDGSVSTFSAASCLPFPRSINAAGAITGNCDVHGFVRERGGTVTTFDAPGAGTTGNGGTVAMSINPSGTITGYFIDANNRQHGFIRKPAH